MRETEQYINKILLELDTQITIPSNNGENEKTVDDVMELILGRKVLENAQGNEQCNVSESDLKKCRDRNNQIYHIDYYREFTPDPSFKGKIKLFIKRIARRLMRPILEPIIEEQNEFNASVTASINEIYNKIVVLEQKNNVENGEKGGE